MLIQRLHESLGLPGTASDYHFALLGAYETLWQRRRDEPEILVELERLCLLDVNLLEVVPSILSFGGDTTFMAHAPAFAHLIHLYERNGLLDDALAIARRGVPLGQCEGEVGRLENRIAVLRSEDA